MFQHNASEGVLICICVLPGYGIKEYFLIYIVEQMCMAMIYLGVNLMNALRMEGWHDSPDIGTHTVSLISLIEKCLQPEFDPMWKW